MQRNKNTTEDDAVFLIPKRMVFTVISALLTGAIAFVGKWYTDSQETAKTAERMQMLVGTVNEMRSDLKVAVSAQHEHLQVIKVTEQKVTELDRRVEQVEAVTLGRTQVMQRLRNTQ